MLNRHSMVALLVTASVLLGGVGSVWAQSAARDFVVTEVRNDRAPFMVRIAVDHENHVYREGEAMRVTVRSERAGYLYVLNCGASGKVHVLFPNKHQTDNRIAAKETVHVPAADSNFALITGEPFGQEVIKAIVTVRPLKTLELDALTKKPVTEISLGSVKDIYVTELRDNPAGWGEHHVRVTTVPMDALLGDKPRRIGVFVGISVYQDPRIAPLSVCHSDADTMAQTMKKAGGFDEVIVLTDAGATLKKIESAIRQQLVSKSKPGDLVLIYWSGHGGRTADESGDEKDGFDEYLVPSDGQFGKIETMLLDDQFGRWVQELDGRKVVVILDTCHSGGQAMLGKNLARRLVAKGLPSPQPKALADFDFLDGELLRAKDIGQRETALLAAARASESAFERQEGDLSVMTYYLVQLLRQGVGPLELPKAYNAIAPQVKKYVNDNLPGATQTPVLVDQTTPPVFLRQ